MLITALMVDERWIVARLQGGAHYYMENPWGWSEELESLCTHDPGLIITWLGIDAVLVEEKKRDRNFQLYTGSRGLMVFDQLVRRQFKPNITS